MFVRKDGKEMGEAATMKTNAEVWSTNATRMPTAPTLRVPLTASVRMVTLETDSTVLWMIRAAEHVVT